MDFTANWGWPQWAVVVLTALSLLIVSSMHGKPREPWNAFTSLVGSGITLFILIAGGFFR